MHPRTRRLLTIALLAAALPIRHASAAGRSPDLDAAIRKSVEALMRDHGIPGMAIAISHHGRHTFYNFGAASKATGRPVSSDTLFEIGSISKTFTATLATYAQATGRLNLTDSPGRFLPELKDTEIARVDLLSLGTHTAGGFPLQIPDGVETREQLMAYYRAWRPQYAAGTARTYANPGIGLLGVVAGKAWSMPFDDAMQKMLFPALGLHDTYITVPPRAMARYAQGYSKTDTPVRVQPGILAAETYGVKTSARDLIRFVDINLAPSSLPARLAQAISATHIGYFRLGAMTQNLAWEQYDAPVALADLLAGNSSQVAYATNRVERLDPPRLPARPAWINKTGATNGFGAYVAFLPAREVGIVILANRNFPIEARVRLAYGILRTLGD